MPKSTAHIHLNKKLFEQLFKKHFVHLSNYAQQYVHDFNSAQDITQKVFINLWENREKIDPQRSIQSYLFTSVRNRCLNHIRDHKKYRSHVLDLDIYDFEMGAEEENEMDVADLKNKIDVALSELPEKCKLVFEMSRYKNMKYKDIAEELNISVKTVEAHISKALKSLRTNLSDYAYFWVIAGGLNWWI